MELMSAVRSVSCNSSMSKCNKTEVDDEEYGPGSEGPPLIDSMYVKQTGGDCPPPPPPPSGTNLSCSNPDLVQVTVTRERGRVRLMLFRTPSCGTDLLIKTVTDRSMEV